MELGLNILSSNRDDAGAAVGDAFGTTRSARTERKRTRAAGELATAERERKQRREDESDSLKQEKADREVAASERAKSKADLDKLQKFELKDGSIAFYEKKEGPVYGEDGKKIILDKKDKDRQSASSRAVTRRTVMRSIGDNIIAIKEGLKGRMTKKALWKKFGTESPTDAQILDLAKSQALAEWEASGDITGYGGAKEASKRISLSDIDEFEEEDELRSYETLEF